MGIMARRRQTQVLKSEKAKAKVEAPKEAQVALVSDKPMEQPKAKKEKKHESLSH
jgi:hypothetical protein